jgi:hypothetical protein
MPSAPVSPTSNAVLVQLQGKERFGKLQVISLMRCYRANILDIQAEIDIRVPADVLQRLEAIALHNFLKRKYPKACTKPETQSVLTLCKVF